MIRERRVGVGGEVVQQEVGVEDRKVSGMDLKR